MCPERKTDWSQHIDGFVNGNFVGGQFGTAHQQGDFRAEGGQESRLFDRAVATADDRDRAAFIGKCPGIGSAHAMRDESAVSRLYSAKQLHKGSRSLGERPGGFSRKVLKKIVRGCFA